MDTIILAAIGIAAVGYAAFTIWRTFTGKAPCNCGCGGAKRKKSA